MKIAVATNNKNKLREIRQILGGSFDELLSLNDLNIDVEIEETGSTFEENALIKARAVLALSGLPSLADDSGLMVDALNGAPGVYSARYAGFEHNDLKNNALLLKNLENKQRTAHFCSVVALCYPDGAYITAKGLVDGEIALEPRGENGFGYDPLFFCPELGKTFAQATAEEKNRISHRSRALHSLLSKLNGK